MLLYITQDILRDVFAYYPRLGVDTRYEPTNKSDFSKPGMSIVPLSVLTACNEGTFQTTTSLARMLAKACSRALFKTDQTSRVLLKLITKQDHFCFPCFYWF